jgi:hypothetical protein
MYRYLLELFLEAPVLLSSEIRGAVGLTAGVWLIMENHLQCGKSKYTWNYWKQLSGLVL